MTTIRFTAALLAAAALPLSPVAAQESATEYLLAQGGTLVVEDMADLSPEEDATRAILMEHVKVLASDAYQGRKPGTEGGRMTVAYQVAKLKEYGYEPGWNGGYEQPVEFATTGGTTAALTVNGKAFRKGRVAVVGGGTQNLSDASIVRVSDAANMGDVAGKIVLVGDFAKARALIGPARDAGAVGAIVYADEESYNSFSAGAQRERTSLANAAGDAPMSLLMLDPPAAKAMEKAVGKKPARLSAAFTGNNGSFTSSNVIAKLPGSRPEAGAIVMLAHWDHTGMCGDEGAEDRVCNGAVDNASGVAAMLETARRLAAGPQLERDVYIFGTTAEELGLLGATYFAQNPPVPLENIHAALNLDTVAIAPANAPLSVIGWERTPLDNSIRGVAAARGRTVEVEDESEKYIRRQDGWALMNRGVPTVLVSSSFGDNAAFDTYMSTRYHGPSDQIWEGFELGGVTTDIAVYVDLMRHWGAEALYSKPAGWAFDNGG